MLQHFVTRCFVSCLLCAATMSASVAQDQRASRSGDSPTATRADLGWSYLRLEQAYFANPPGNDQRIAEVNQAFDTATKKFFSGKFGETIAEVNQLTASLMADQPSPALQVALSLRAAARPAVVRLDDRAGVQIELAPLYPTDIPSDLSLQLLLEPVGAGEAIRSASVPLRGLAETGDPVVIAIDQSERLRSGAYRILVTDGAGVSVSIGMLNVVPSSLDAVRRRNAARLDEFKSDQPHTVAAVRACRSRNELLSDTPSVTNSAQFLANLSELSNEIRAEIDTLANGGDPYRGRSGDYWRTFSADADDKPVACRVYAPKAASGDDPVPLVIALHGAGGDENMFFTGYGAGKIKQLADEFGFLVASPATNAVGGRGERLDNLIAELSSDYPVDPKRIYLIGHSMGGFATATLSAKRSDRIAAACCLAGGGRAPATSLPPTLIVAGELDSVIPLAMLQPMAQAAIDAGLPVTFQVEKHYGHTLMVGAMLPAAIQWLLEHRLE